jgi:inhibitor of KinA sporulation pathway (predicted exonuclease)
MKYFIDFEATQYSNRIISVGCVNEEGAAFYSLVNPHKELTPFITSLTGITQEMADAAPEANEVFEALYDFCCDDDEAPEFLCYGDTDKDFCVATFYKMATSFKAKTLLAYLHTGLIDFSPIVKSHFGLRCNIALNKVANYYKGEENVQKHNALEDAEMLLYVYNEVMSHENEFDAFPEHGAAQGAAKVKKEVKDATGKNCEYMVFRLKKGRVAETYYTLADAIMWVIDHKMKNQNAVPENIGKKILSAARNGKQYCSLYWAIAEKAEG